ncbi:translation initiation factor IF-2-like [Meles meles]|uniref:translation initiation factor IF-2-like n=1 Tax=Meles meles TaxID=9662 RepID=UPI001E69DF0F|nr:translation initiation factor IF-2-like [Meles meles]
MPGPGDQQGYRVEKTSREMLADARSGRCLPSGAAAAGTQDSEYGGVHFSRQPRRPDSASGPGSKFSRSELQGAPQRRPAAPARRRHPEKHEARLISQPPRREENESLPGPRASSPPGRDWTTRGLRAGRRAASSLPTSPVRSAVRTQVRSPSSTPTPGATLHSPHSCPAATRPRGRAPGRVRLRRPGHSTDRAPRARSGGALRGPLPRPGRAAPAPLPTTPCLDRRRPAPATGASASRRSAVRNVEASPPPTPPLPGSALRRAQRPGPRRFCPATGPGNPSSDFRASVAALGGGGPATWCSSAALAAARARGGLGVERRAWKRRNTRSAAVVGLGRPRDGGRRAHGGERSPPGSK